jgi:hypothetical protein
MIQTTDADSLIQSLTDLDDPTVCTALADLLEEQGHAAAGAVRELADARPAIPEPEPDLSPGTRSPVCHAMACGGWWDVKRVARRNRKPKGVFWDVDFQIRSDADTPDQLFKARVNVPFRRVVTLGRKLHSPEDLRRAFEALRRMVIGGMLRQLVEQVEAADRIELCLAKPGPDEDEDDDTESA